MVAPAAPGSSKKRTADDAEVADEEMVSETKGSRRAGCGRRFRFFPFPFFLPIVSLVLDLSERTPRLGSLPRAQDGSPPKKAAGDDEVDPVGGGTTDDPASSVVESLEEKKVESAAEAAVAAAEAPAVAQQ